METSLHIFGIRHHGPGSARSVQAALEALQPDVVLVEGPPDAHEVLPLLAHEQMQPPVALLIYAPEQPQQAVYYPFVEYSPEWQAIRYALDGKIPVRFMDLPITHQMKIVPPLDDKALQEMQEKTEPVVPEEKADDQSTSITETPLDDSEEEPAIPAIDPRRDPLRWIAEAAGYNDSERWWEDMVEHRADTSDVFAAILEAMTALREEVEKWEIDNPAVDHFGLDPVVEKQREAWMRQSIRAAQKEGFQKIAVVCGAWHAPALQSTLNDKKGAKEDAALLKGLSKTKVAATWVPWTNGRMCTASGYGAGIESPGWYSHLWNSRDLVAPRWLAKVASLLREQDLDASSAHVIEAVRLAEALASMRGRPLPGLPELNEAVQSILCFGNDIPLRLIRDKLIVGEALGTVPEEAPSVPLQQDLAREQKRLRLAPEATQKVLDLDLRKPNDLNRSYLLHRLNLIGVPWGAIERSGGGKGTFHELWRVQWQPEFAVRLIEAGIWGNTVSEATTARTRDLADKATDLPPLTTLLDSVLLANLPAASEHVMQRLESAAATTSDVTHLMDALPPLSQVLRYGNVRQTDNQMVAHIVDGLVARICIGVLPATSSLNDEAAQSMLEKINAVTTAIALNQQAEHTQSWHNTLRELASRTTLHGLLAGRSVRILLDAGALETVDAARRMSLALSTADDPAQAAAWVEGFLKGSAAFLLHDERLWQVLDDWVTDLNPETFEQLLPLLRRTFSTFSPPERRQMGERVKQGTKTTNQGAAKSWSNDAFDADRAAQVLPLVAKLLGLKETIQ
jgi:hypothetical protein